MESRAFLIKRARFESLAEGICNDCPEKENGCGELLYNCEKVKDKLMNVKFKEPYKMKWIEFTAGKHNINETMFRPNEEIEVIDFYNLPVRKGLLDEYAHSIINRLRKIQRNGEVINRWDIWYSGVENRESVRGKLHSELLNEAGYEQADMRDGAQLLRAMIEVYLENEAKKWGVM